MVRVEMPETVMEVDIGIAGDGVKLLGAGKLIR